MIQMPPRLETERLVLRAHKSTDFPAAIAMWADPIVTRYTIGAPSSEQRTWTRLLSYLGHWNLLGFGYWAVEEKVSGEFIGELGFADFKRDIKPSIAGVPELGWALVSSAHGKGYATEALKKVIQWGDKNLNVARTVCIINIVNKVSLRVAEKLEYKSFAETLYNSESSYIFERFSK